MLLRDVRCLLIAAVATLLPPSDVRAGESSWLDDLGPALDVARQEGKDLLVDFTGSDWCGWCIRLDAEVFSKPEFGAYAAERFVLVALDFPRPEGETWNAMTPELRERNDAELQRYGVRGFPTILLLSPDGVMYAQTGYREGGAASYTEHLEALRTGPGAESRAQVEQLRAGEGAARLEAAYALFEGARDGLRSEILEVVRAEDPQDSRGLLAMEQVNAIVNAGLQADDPDYEAVERDLAALSQTNGRVLTLPAFHLARGWIALERGDVPLARACAARLQALPDADPAAAQWLEDQAAEIAGDAEGNGEDS